MSEIKIEPSWKIVLEKAFAREKFGRLKEFLKAEKSAKKIIYPPEPQIFSAFDNTPFEQVKVVILGQDPYHGPNQAHGLCFSVNDGIPFPPSLRNIFKEMQEDLPGFKIPLSGNLISWTRQGVLLLNATLTVRAAEAGSHQNKGWENFTDEVIRQLSEKREHLVFILWGNFAQSKARLIDSGKHHIIKSAHPSPLSAYNGFFGSKPFSQTNQYLLENRIKPIDWEL